MTADLPQFSDFKSNGGGVMLGEAYAVTRTRKNLEHAWNLWNILENLWVSSDMMGPSFKILTSTPVSKISCW